jgi:hypothetical protein
MESEKRLSIERRRDFSAHHMLVETAEEAAESAVAKLAKEEHGWKRQCLIAITCSGLALEAFCNAFGGRVIPNWEEFLSCTPLAKLRLICEHSAVAYDRTREPWASMIWLSKFRNRVAHAKPESIKTTHVMTEAEYYAANLGHPQSELEDDLTIRNAKKAVTSIKKVIELLCDALPLDQKWGLSVDMSFGKASVIKKATVPS